MKTQNKYWMIIAVALVVTVAALCTLALLFWKSLPSENRQSIITVVFAHFGYFFSAGFLLLMAFGFAADWIFRAYVRPINRLAEEIDLINTVNPDLRVTVRGSFDVRRLARIINQSAELATHVHKSQAEQLKQSKAEIETEKAILATLLSDLPQGIVVCNLDSRIVFYNRKAKDLLAPHAGANAGAGNGSHWVGLGRSLFGFIDKTLIQEALARIADKLSQDRSMANERFLIGTKDHSPLPAELQPVLDSQHHVTGFILYIEDLGATLHQAEEESQHLQLWQHQLTQSISIIKTAAELIHDDAFKSDPAYHQMVQILAEQSDLAAKLWTQKEIADRWSNKVTRPLTPISIEQWAQLIWQQVSPVLNLELKITQENQQVRISIDIHHMTQIVVSIIKRVHLLYKIDTVQAQFYQVDDWLYVDIIWKGEGVDPKILKQWKAEAVNACGGPSALPMGNLLAFHRARLWPYRKPTQKDWAGVRFLIPTLEDAGPAKSNDRITILPESRPEFYDFDLFQHGSSPELDNRRLSEITFSVFDTETTGLDPSSGDEIISIGAIRIVNGRLLHKEQFGQLIDPKRHLPWESIKYHGIRPEMLVDQPTIEQVLPMFQRFVQDTVLVGHNVAFDMRMLQVKEHLTGICFQNPVLDTLLLSSVVHPAQEDHSLGSIAQRLGVNIVGRHTATGDALATAEIFLKLISLLANQGIHTLLEAREASKKSYYARLKY